MHALFHLLACSGRMAYMAIYESQAIGRQHGLAFAAMVLASLTLWVVNQRPLAMFPTIMLTLGAVHPALWDDGMHGDCGGNLAGLSPVWSIFGIVTLLLQLFFWIWPPRPRQPRVIGFPVEPAKPSTT